MGELGDSGLGLLLTLSRMIRKHGGDVVLAAPGPGIRRTLDEMMLDDYWETFDDVGTAKAWFPNLNRASETP
jgi:anti-anti-sigma regulatory factor